MSKKILLITLLSSITFSEELTFSDRAGASFLLGVQKSVNGIVEKSKNFEPKLHEFQTEEIERLGKGIKNLNEKNKKLIKLYNEEKEKNRKLKVKISELEKVIKKHNMKETDIYYQKQKKEDEKSKAIQDLKEQLKAS